MRDRIPACNACGTLTERRVRVVASGALLTVTDAVGTRGAHVIAGEGFAVSYRSRPETSAATVGRRVQ
jgi:hypothetical protein